MLPDEATLMTLIAGLFAIILYSVGTALQAWDAKETGRGRTVTITAALAVVAHGLSAWGVIYDGEGFRFGIVHISTVVTAAVSLLVLLSSLQKPLQPLFLGLFPLAAIAILASLLFDSDYPATQLNSGLAGHIMLSILGYGFFTIAALQAGFLALQNHHLKSGHIHSTAPLLNRLPSLEAMETLLFELLWAGQLLLSLGILAGFVFVDDLWSHAGVIHKTFFSITAWLVFAALLWGHHQAGWRGPTAVRYTLSGFALLLLGFYGSKFVLEYILA